MRAGGCTLQQALTQEAATVVKQSVSLARRRGHAQVTPLHVASTMLSSSSCLLRAACLQSHSHPLQCKALELCFNVALNRLPASTAATSSPMLGHHHHLQPPALSNALVAAFKRAQAHQRRGSVESQQQPLLAVKIEVEQLVISILDDPSVSRVMREAGFSSTQVKTNVEQAVSLELSSSSSPTPNHKPLNDDHHLTGTSSTSPTFQVIEHLQEARSEDVMSVVDCLMGRKKRNIVIVGESLSTTEGVMKGLMDKVERGDVPDLLRSIQFINLPLFSFAHMKKDEVEHKIGELRCLVKSCSSCVGRGVVLYLGDLKWAAEYRASFPNFDHSRDAAGKNNYYCPVDHVIIELGRMVSGGITSGDVGFGGGRFWFMGLASYNTYMRCRVGMPSLENIWSLHPLTIPAGSLGLSLSHDSHIRNIRKYDENDNNGRAQTLNLLPSWLQQYKEDKEQSSSDKKNEVEWINKERCFLTYDVNQSPASSTSSSDHQSMEIEYHHKFKELSAENLKTLCNSLEKKVPWQTEIIPEIASTVLQCRSGLMRKKDGCGGPKGSRRLKEDTWFFFHGCDAEGKEKMARELANLVFGSCSSFVSINGTLTIDSSPEKSDSGGDDHFGRNKRSRRGEPTHLERFTEEIGENPHRVFFIEDMDQVEHRCQLGIKTAIQRGTVFHGSSDEQEFGLEDAIVILNCESFESSSRASSPSTKVKYSDQEKEEEEEGSGRCALLDLNQTADDEDEDFGYDLTVDDVGLVEWVDRVLFFKKRED